MHSLGKARTAQVQKDARIGEAEAKRDAGIRVRELGVAWSPRAFCVPDGRGCGARASGAGLAEDVDEAGPRAKIEELSGEQDLSLGPSSAYLDALPNLCMNRRPKPSRRRCLLST